MSAWLDRLLQREWSERQQVAAILGVAGLLILALWFFLLMPQNRTRRGLEREIADMRDQLAQRDALISEEALEARRRSAEAQFRERHETWTAATERLTAEGLRMGPDLDGVGAIDYKVALFEARDRLRRRARDARVMLPRDLGLEEEVAAGEDAHQRMLQLRTVEYLAELFLDLRIGAVRAIEPLSPRRLRSEDGGPVFAEEYPVRVEFYGNLEHLFALFQEVYGRQPVFTLRRAQVAEVDPSQTDLLRMEVEFCALVFVSDPAELATPPRPATPPRRPLGI